MVDLGQKGWKKFRLFYFIKVRDYKIEKHPFEDAFSLLYSKQMHLIDYFIHSTEIVVQL